MSQFEVSDFIFVLWGLLKSFICKFITVSPLLVANDNGVAKLDPKILLKISDSSGALSFTPCSEGIRPSFATIEVKPKDAANANGKVLPLFALMSMSGCERRRSTNV